MLKRKIFAYVAGGVLLSLAAAAPALATGTQAPTHASAAATGCVTSLGVCDARFCAYASFATGNWYFEWLGGGQNEMTYWHAYYNAPNGNQYDYGEVSPTC